MTEELEIRKIEIEESRLAADIDLKKRELDLREKELEDKSLQDKRESKFHFTPLATAIIGSMLALASAGLTGYLGGYWSLVTQREKNNAEFALKEKERQFQIVIKSTENRTPEEASNNLKFFVDIGYLPDPEGKISKKAQEGAVPVITTSGGRVENPLLERYSELKKSRATGQPINVSECQVKNHLLVDKEGNAISVAPIPSSSLFPGLKPKLIVLHFTASGNVEGVAKSLHLPSAIASYHVLIYRDGKVMQLVPFDYMAQHAGSGTWKHLTNLNRYGIAISLDNWGQLQKSEKKWVTYGKREIPHSEVVEIKGADGKTEGWHKYTDDQVNAVIAIAKCLVKAYPTIKDIVGHEHVSKYKPGDPGPAFPLEKVRDEVFRSRGANIK